MNTFFQPLTLTTAFAKCVLWVFTLTIMSSISTLRDAQANPAPPGFVALKFTPPPPPDRGAPGNRRGAGSRGCGLGDQPLQALMPVYEQTMSQNQEKSISITQVWGLTSVENPTFWFSVPYRRSSITAIEFSLQNEQKKTIRTSVTIPQAPGIVSFRLPSSSATLEVGKNYHWFFKVYVVSCDPQQPTERDYVEGWVQRTNLNPQLGDRLHQAIPQTRVALYTENGLWYDALTTLAELRLANPKDTDLTEEWKSLLQSVGLGNLANQPLVKCCLPK